MSVKRFCLSLLCWIGLTVQGFAAELIKPDPTITPEEVVSIQLMALQTNDTPATDHGIRQTWAFAHPQNRAMTGPLDRFTRMIRNETYGVLLDHRQHTITTMNTARDWVQFKVLIEDSRGRALSFYWVVKKVEEGENADCWMTSAVSPPSVVGQGS